MSSRSKKNHGQDLEEKAKELKVYSWTLEEYQEAVKHDLLYESVVGVMGLRGDLKEGSRRHEPQEQESERRKREVESKYQIVGGSCRYMFESTREEAIQDLRDAMDSVNDVQTLLSFGMGDRAKQFVNRLHGKYRTGGKVQWALISKFVATELAQKHGESFVRQVEELSGMAENPALRGVLFEMLFFARTAKEPGLQVITTGTKESIKWGVFAVEVFDPTQVYNSAEQSRERVCLKPLKWNQGGYDAVIVDWKTKTVRFVQVTISETHDLKLRYFSECLDSLRIEGSPWTVEIVFVVPTENVDKFRVSRVENRGMLSRCGWLSGREESQAYVAGMDRRSCG